LAVDIAVERYNDSGAFGGRTDMKLKTTRKFDVCREDSCSSLGGVEASKRHPKDVAFSPAPEVAGLPEPPGTLHQDDAFFVF
jgi:hypothetical protein